jgi:pyrimidine operon attenuation protein/uracil phosphoribosyltransferase
MIRLLVLVDRGGRELPIQADFVGIRMKDVPNDHRVNVRLKEVDQIDEIVVEPKNA